MTVLALEEQASAFQGSRLRAVSTPSLPTLLTSPCNSSADRSPKRSPQKAWSPSKSLPASTPKESCPTLKCFLPEVKGAERAEEETALQEVCTDTTAIDTCAAAQDDVSAVLLSAMPSQVHSADLRLLKQSSHSELPPALTPSPSPRKGHHRTHHAHCPHQGHCSRHAQREGKKHVGRKGASEHRHRSLSHVAPLPGASASAARDLDGIACKMTCHDDLCGFQVGAAVMTDAEGPWRGLGNGTVVGPGLQKGILNVKFVTDKSVDGTFAVRAIHLRKAVERPATSPESHMKRFGISVGDAVAWQKEGRGIVVGAGTSPWSVTVKFGGIGTRSVPLDQVTKVVFRSLSKGGLQPSKEERAATWANVEPHRPPTQGTQVSNTLKVGDYVRAKEGHWKNMGIGIVKKVGEKLGSACVKFNILGESWTLSVDLLERVEDPGYCEFHYNVRKDFEHKRKRHG